MTTDTKLLTLVQWLSPGFPVSSYAYSHGLEAAVADGHVHDAASLLGWLEGILAHGSGRMDAIWLRLAFEAGDLATLDAQARAFQSSRLRLRESERQGAAFVRTLNAVWGDELPDLLLPVAVGAAAARHGLDIEDTCTLYLHSFTSALVAAAQRLMPLGQTGGQRVIAQLQAPCQHAAAAAKGAGLPDIHGAAFMSDIAAMRHETLHSRMFQS